MWSCHTPLDHHITLLVSNKQGKIVKFCGTRKIPSPPLNDVTWLGLSAPRRYDPNAKPRLTRTSLVRRTRRTAPIRGSGVCWAARDNIGSPHELLWPIAGPRREISAENKTEAILDQSALQRLADPPDLGVYEKVAHDQAGVDSGASR